MEKYNLTQTGAEVQEILNTAIPQSELTEEVGRAQGAEQTLQDKIDAEELRAKAAESDLEQADTVLQGNIDAEELRAKAAESDLEQADTVLQGNIDAEELRAKAAEKQNADEIDVIEEKIPTEASSSNQLADKAFVNSSIASNTATYRGSFNQVNDLHLTLEATEADIATALESVIDNADNNDYCYIQVPVSESAPTEIAQVDRYKFNGTTWAYEYTLNNSGFTADQWAALNSAITSGLVAKLSALPNMAELTALLAGKQNLLNFDNVPTTGSNNPVTSGGVKTAIDDEKTRAQAAEQANNLLITQINGKIPSDATSENKLVDKAYVDAADATMQSAIEGILALIPEAATALNQLADKAFVNSSIATNTGTFKGTYNVVLDLELFYDATHAQIALMLASKITSAKNNDYCYVQVPNSNEDPTSINHTDRYKYNGTAWAYEYTLNNSGFTTAQWAAINSGITELLKNKLVDLPTATELAALLNAKQNTLTFDTAPTPNSTNPVTSDGIHAAINVEKERAEAAEEELDTNKADKATTLAGYGITDAYTKNEVNNMITTPNQQYVTVATYASLPASGSKDTIYRVSNYNGANSQVDNTVYSEYAWNGTQYVFLCVKSQIEEVFDITVYNSNTKYADLAAALGVDGANIPATLRRGGMSVKFVQSSDNKYVQFRYMGTEVTGTPNPFLNTANWQGVDDEPTTGSENLVKSGGVDKALADYSKYQKEPITASAILSKAYVGPQTVEDTIRIYTSQSSNNKVLAFNIKDKKLISIFVPKASKATGAVALAYTNEDLSTGEWSETRSISGEYIDIQISSVNGHTVITNDDNYKYVLVSCNYSDVANIPVVASVNTIEYDILNEKIDENTAQLAGSITDSLNEAKTYSDFNFIKYNKIAQSEISIVSYAYITAPTTEGNVRINKSSAAKNKVIFYDIQGLNILSVVIPDTSGVSASSLYSFLALTNEKIDTSDLSKAKNLSGIYIDTSSLPRYDVKTLVKNTGNYKYLAVFATVNSNEDMPTVSECKTDEYIKLNQQIQDTNTALDNYKGFVAECNENDLVVIPCGKNTQSHPTVWTCFIDEEYSYIGYRAKFSRIKHHSTGVVEIVADVELSGGDASLYEEIFKYHIVTGIATDANYIYISTRDRSVGTDTPLSGVGGYLMIYNKSTLALVKKVELVDSSNPIYKGMQCYLYKNNYLIIPLQKRGWCMYDITDVNNPVCQYHQSSIEHQHCKYWSANNHDYAAFTCFGSGVIIWDITDLSNVSVIGRWKINDTIEEPQYIIESFAIALNYPYLYVTVAPTSENMQSEYAVKGVVCFDVTNPATFNTTAKLSEIPRSYWGTTQDADGQPNNMAFYGNVIAVNLDGKGLGVFSADGDNVEFVKVITYNTFIRPITVSKDGLFMAGGQYIVVYNRFINAASINNLIEDVKYLKSVIQNLT